MRNLYPALCGLIALCLPSIGSATLLTFQTTLSGLNEVPPNASGASGQALVTVDTAAHTLSLSVDFLGMTAVPTAAHIHCCTPAGSNAGVAIGFPAFPATTAGSYLQLFDLTLPTTYGGTFLTNAGGTAAAAEAALTNGLLGGLAYVNIHTSTFPGGEIRGQLSQSSIPEPVPLALLGSGILAMGYLRKRSRR